MNETDKQNAHQTMLVIWGALLGSQLLFGVLVYVAAADGLFPLDLSKPFFGEHALFVALAIVFAVGALIFSFYRRSAILQKSVEDQSIALVQQALITSIALAESVTLCGLFLAFAFRYPYFFIWMIVGFAATALHFPQRRDIDNATFKSLQ